MKRTLWVSIALLVMVAVLFSMVGCAGEEPAPTAAPAAPTAAGPAAPTAEPATPAEPTTAAAPSGEAVTLNWVSFVAVNDNSTVSLQKNFFDKVNEQAKGKLEIKFRGGPEAIAAFDQGKAVQNGVVDISVVPVGFYEALVPGVGGVGYMSITVDEMRKNGGFDYVQEMHNKAGLYYLGQARPSNDLYFYTYLKNEKVETIDRFKNLKLGAATALAPAVQAWGSSLTSLAIAEYYSALERNVVDGVAGTPLSTARNLGFGEVVDYVIDTPLFASTSAMIMNLDSWNKLSPELQEIILDVKLEADAIIAVEEAEWNAEAKQDMIDLGVEFYKLPPDVEKWWVDTANEAAWAAQMKKFPEPTPRLQELLSK